MLLRTFYLMQLKQKTVAALLVFGAVISGVAWGHAGEAAVQSADDDRTAASVGIGLPVVSLIGAGIGHPINNRTHIPGFSAQSPAEIELQAAAPFKEKKADLLDKIEKIKSEIRYNQNETQVVLRKHGADRAKMYVQYGEKLEHEHASLRRQLDLMNRKITEIHRFLAYGKKGSFLTDAERAEISRFSEGYKIAIREKHLIGLTESRMLSRRKIISKAGALGVVAAIPAYAVTSLALKAKSLEKKAEVAPPEKRESTAQAQGAFVE